MHKGENKMPHAHVSDLVKGHKEQLPAREAQVLITTGMLESFTFLSMCKNDKKQVVSIAHIEDLAPAISAGLCPWVTPVTVYGSEDPLLFSASCGLSQRPWDLFLFLVVFKNVHVAAG